MRNVRLLALAGVLLVCVAAQPAMAWGPVAQTSVVTAAANLLVKETRGSLRDLMGDIRIGAALTPAQLEAVIPDATTRSLDALKSEMYLLGSVRGERIDAYYAYRLGALGALAAQLSAPMRDASPGLRAQYFDDVDTHFNDVKLDIQPRRDVDPNAYFASVQADSARDQGVIEEDYRTGTGFSGLASQSLSIDVSRSVNVVADVMYTVLVRSAGMVSISQDQVRRYYTGAVAYYLEQNRAADARRATERLETSGGMTPETRKQIAGLFFDNKEFDIAVETYRRVLEELPGDKDASSRIAAYLVKQGDDALARDQLERARDFYQDAANTDALDSSIREKLLSVENELMGRMERSGTNRGAVEAAIALEEQADAMQKQGDVGGAMEAMLRARALYESVTAEFPDERRIAESGAQNLSTRITELRGQLVTNALSLSGAGSSSGARVLAGAGLRPLSDTALREYIRKAYDSQVSQAAGEAGERLDAQ